MDTRPITRERLAQSVIAVPPLARDGQLKICPSANQSLIKYMEEGGISTLLYGGNAVFYHIALSEYATACQLIAESAHDDTLVIPSVGPAFGTMLDQATILADFDFPTVMVLPQLEVATPAGRASGIRHFAEAYGKPIVLYIKHPGYMEVGLVQQLMDDGLVSAIKYAIVRDDPNDDAYLHDLVDTVGPELIVSGIGEQPAIAHMKGFGLVGFTSGCVCVAPGLSMQMLKACSAGDWETAERLRQVFAPLEDLRNSIHPIRVLHAAVTLAEICDTGPITPHLSPIDEEQSRRVAQAAKALKMAEQA